MLEAGDTLYLPKGVVHYAEGTGELSIHATIGILREGATWFDLVYDELVERHRQSKNADAIMHPDVIEHMVQSTQLGVRLAQLVPHGSHVEQLNPTREPLEEHLLGYMDELVDAVLFHATSLPTMPQPNPKIYGHGYSHEAPLQHLTETHFCPALNADADADADADPEFDPTLPSERSIAARVASLQFSENPDNFLGLARDSR